MKSIGMLLLFASTVACGFEVDSSTLVWHAPKSGEVPMNSELWEKGSIKMPVVRGGSAGVSARINDALFMSRMQTPAPEKPGKSFSLPEGVSPEGTTQLDFQVSRNDAQVLEIEFTGEGCGAYCEDYTNTVDFDARTGHSISLDDLLTPAGKVMVAKRMHKERNRRYLAQIRELKKARKEIVAAAKQPGYHGDLDDTDARIELNESCIEPEQGQEAQPSTVRYLRFALPSDGGLVLVAGRCSAHVVRALDDVGDVTLSLTSKDLTPLLTPYGRALLSGQQTVAPPSVFGQVLHGKLGNAAITMVLHESFDDGSFDADYYYNKYRKLIHLDGARTGNQLRLTEHIDDRDTAVFTLELGATGLSGAWVGGGRTLAVVVGE